MLMTEMTAEQRRQEIALGYRCPDCDIPLLINPHLDRCAGVAALNDAWRAVFPKDPDDPMGFRTMPSPWNAFERGWWAGRVHERQSKESN
jgi:hypothetical protein